MDIDDDIDNERPEFKAADARVMDVISGNFEHDAGEPAVIVTIAMGDHIEPLAFPVEEAKKFICKGLVALATMNDVFAQKLLDDHFPADNDAQFIWPPEP